MNEQLSGLLGLNSNLQQPLLNAPPPQNVAGSNKGGGGGGGAVAPQGGGSFQQPLGAPSGGAGAPVDGSMQSLVALLQSGGGWGAPGAATSNAPLGGAAPQNMFSGGTPLRGYQGGPNRTYNQQANQWEFNPDMAYQGGPNRVLNDQTNQWQFKPGMGYQGGPKRTFNQQTNQWEWI